MNMFEKAARQKLRFESPKGMMSVEDVWDLPLKHQSRFDLDTLAKGLNRAIKQNEEESFVEEPSASNSLLHTKMDIVKHIIEVRRKERDASAKASETRARNEKIKAIIERKQDEALESRSEQELLAMLQES